MQFLSASFKSRSSSIQLLRSTAELLRHTKMSSSIALSAVSPSRFHSSKPDMVFLGTGVSHALPIVPCLTKPEPTCKVCLKGAGLYTYADGSGVTEEDKKNKRNNVSLLIRVPSQSEDGPMRHVVIDAGKTFRQASLEFFPKFRVSQIDAVLLTHEHADACGGIDDLRAWTMANKSAALPFFAGQKDLDTVRRMYPYLFTAVGGKSPHGHDIAQIDFKLMEHGSTFEAIPGFEVSAFQVFHGNKYPCFSFKFGNVGYMSDVSEIPEDVRPQFEDLDILVLDYLREEHHFSHFNRKQALEEVQRLRPRHVYFVGMDHGNDHAEINTMLQEWKLTCGVDRLESIQLAFDGQHVPIVL